MTYNNPIATYTASNTMVILIYDIIYGVNDYILAGYNDQKPRKYKIYYNSRSTYFNFGKMRINLNDCIKCN